MADTIAYKVLDGEQLRALEADAFEGAPVDVADGYVHLSTAAQVEGTIERHFAGRDDLHIAAVDLDAAGDAVRWEVSRGGELFPHLYARLAPALVVASGPVERGPDGALRLPGSGEA